MKVPNKILVGLAADESGENASEGSLAAARQALWLASSVGASVEFVHSIHTEERGGAAGPDAAGLSDGLRRAVDSLKVEHGGSVDVVGVRVVSDHAWMALIQSVLAGDGDWVVVGKRDQSRRDDRKLGGVSLKLVSKCPAPVWVVRPDHDAKHKSILAATDLSPVGDLATDYGAFLAKAVGCELSVAHAWQVPMELQFEASRLGGDEVAKRKAEIVDAARAHIVSRPGVAELGAAAKIYIACDTPSHVILEVAERVQPDLAVLGTVSRGGIPGMLVGNTAERLLYQLDCSLLTVKPDDFVCPLASPADS